MKFTAIVITKRRIITILSVTAAICAAAVFTKTEKSIPLFNPSASYRDIVSEELPGTDSKLSIKKLVNKLVGFDTDNPAEIVRNELPPASESTDVPPAEENESVPEDAEPPSAAPLFPTRGEIDASTGLSANNATDYSIDINALCGEPLPFTINKDEPSVLVIHTHTTECYNGDAMSGETERTTDDAKNMIAVGNVVCGILEEYGIKTIHDTTVHDYPSYRSAYTRALSTINSRLEQYPSIQVILDVHRDAFIYSDGSKLRVSCEQNGIKAAKVMLVAGTDSMGLSHPEWRGNLTFAAKIQNAAQIMYPGLMRPVDIRRERFNMHAAPGSLLLEIGSNGNSLEEALEGAADAARAISAVLLSN